MRKSALALAAVVLLSVAVGGVHAQQSDVTITAATEELTRMEVLGITIPGAVAVDSRAVQATAGGSTSPQFIVTVEEGDLTALEDWTNQSDRRVIAERLSDERAVVTAPVGVVGLSPTDRLLKDTLAERDYVNQIAINQQVEVDPIQVLRDPADRATPSGLLTRQSWPDTGVAYSDDAPETTPAEVREILGVDNVSATGAGVRVAVLDTGINTASGEIYGNGSSKSDPRIAAAYNFVTDEKATLANNYENVADGNGHGSWVASAIAADTTDTTYEGVAPDAELLVGKVLADDGSGSSADIIEGIRWAERNDADVLSMSLGTPLYSEAMADALRDFVEGNGTVAVVAVGNSRFNPAVRYVGSPADVPDPGVIGVAATNGRPASNASSAYFSQVGPDPARDASMGASLDERPDVAAPGMNTTVRTADGDRTLSGTSMATPYVAGTVALGLEAEPSLENDTQATRERLLEGARPIPAAGVTEVGQGMAAADNYIDNTAVDRSQQAARTDAAVARDEANRGYAQAQVRGAVERLLTALGG